MHFFVVGSNHSLAPVAIRERFAVDERQNRSVLSDLCQQAGLSEAVILSTCNRFECYFCADTTDNVIAWLAERGRFEHDAIDQYLYIYEGREVLAHLFRVACGLDSIMLGENQILRQIKVAFDTAKQIGVQGKWLTSVFQATMATAKYIRHHTQIGQHSLSIPSTVMNLVKNAFNTPSDVRVLFIGAGEMIAACAALFSHYRFKEVSISNRHLAHAETIASTLSASLIPLEALSDQTLAGYDIVISCTASPVPLITHDMVQKALSRRTAEAPVLMIDLAVPRDIDAQIANLAGIELYSIDDLGRIVQQGKQKREEAAAYAESMIDQRVSEFIDWWQHRRHIPLIFQLRDQAEKLNQTEVERALRKLSQGQPAEEVLLQFGQRLTNKLLHTPIAALHDAGKDDALASKIATSYGIDYKEYPPSSITI